MTPEIAVRQEIITSQLPDISERVIAVPPEEWGATQLLEYVRAQITFFHGPQPASRNDLSVFEELIERFGNAGAVRIARAAFEVHQGMWMGAPVSPARFGPSSDGVFSRRILASA